MFVEAIARLKQSLIGPQLLSEHFIQIGPRYLGKRAQVPTSRVKVDAAEIASQGSVEAPTTVLPPDVMLHVRLGLRRRY